MSQEVRIGALALVTIALGLWGLKFIQGQNLLARTDTYFAFYENVGGVQIGTPVQVSGVTVGAVSGIDLSDTDRRVMLTLEMERDLPLPKATRAVLVTTSVLGDMAIYLEYDQPCPGSGPDCAADQDTLRGVTRGMIEAILGEGGVDQYVETLNDGLKEVLDSLNEKLLGEDSDSPVAETARDLQSTMASLKDAAARTNLLLQRSSPALESALDDVSQLTATLAEQRDAIGQILANADTLSQQLVDAELNAVIADVQETIQQLSATLGTTNEAMAGVNDLVGKVQQGEGTLGKLMTDEALYQNLSELTYSLDSLMADLQERPYRYFPLKSRRRVNRYDQQDANNQ